MSRRAFVVALAILAAFALIGPGLGPSALANQGGGQTPTIRLVPASGPPGGSVQVQGSGFQPGIYVAVDFGNNRVDQNRFVDSTGTFMTSFATYDPTWAGCSTCTVSVSNMLKSGALATATFTFTAAPLSAPPSPTPTVQTIGCTGQAPSFPPTLTQGEGGTFSAWGFQPGSAVTLTITGAPPVTAVADSACQVSQRVLTSTADLPGQYTITASGPKAGGGTQTATLTFVLRAASLPGNVAVLPPQVVPPSSGQVVPPAFSIPVVPPSTSGQTPPNSIAGRPPLPANPFGPQVSGGQSSVAGQPPASQGQPPVAGSDPPAPPSTQSNDPSPASGAGSSALGELPLPGSIPGMPPTDPAATGGSDPLAGSSPFIPPVTMPTLDPNTLMNLDAKMREMEEEAKKKAAEEDETDAVLFSAYFHGLLIMNMAEGLGLTVSDLDATALAECAVVLKRGGVDPESDQYTIAFTLCYRAETAE